MPGDVPDGSTFEIQESEFAAAVSPADLKGRINLRIDQALQQEIEDIADDMRYPLNSSSEVVRFCLIDGIERLRQWRPAPTLLGRIKAASALVIRDKMQCEILELLERLDERVNWYLANGYFEEVIDLVARVRSYFDGLDDFWAKRVRDDLDTRFVTWMDTIDSMRKDK